MRIILDLCGGSGAWSEPYSKAGQLVNVIDPNANAYYEINTRETVQQFLEYLLTPGCKYPYEVGGILMAPPCTEFSGSGARWWRDKELFFPERLECAIETVLACLAIKDILKPDWWCLEQPVGRIMRCVPKLGKWKMTFQPNHYGDPWTKLTCLYGEFNVDLERNEVEPTEGSKMHLMSPGPERAAKRAETSPGFAKAFCKANP